MGIEAGIEVLYNMDVVLKSYAELNCEGVQLYPYHLIDYCFQLNRQSRR